VYVLERQINPNQTLTEMNLRSLNLGTALLLGIAAFAQPLPPYDVTVGGIVLGCTPNSFVNITTNSITQPTIDIDVVLDANCGFSVDLLMDSYNGGFILSTGCNGALLQTAAAYQVNALAPDSNYVFVTFNCIDPVVDCLGVLGGFDLPGTPCGDNNPNTVNDTWSADCICSGTICEPPVLTSPSGFLAICSSDSLILQATTTGTGPFAYSWTGPGNFIPNNTAQNVYLHDFASGTYHVTVTNACGTAEAEVLVTVTPAPDAGISTGISICDITVPTDMFLLLGGNPQTGGSWTYASLPHSSVFDPAVDTLGTYQYTIMGTAPCSWNAASVFIGPVPTWFGDADGDGLGDLDVSLVSCIQPVGYVNNDADHCPLIFGTIGSICDDGNPLTTNDLIDATCVCAGIDSSNVDCLNIPNGPNVPGTACTDPTGTTGIWSAGCVCIADTTNTGCQACYSTTQVAPFTALFTSCSTGGTAPFEIFWDFAPGGGVLGDSTTQVYPGPGTYIACLNILDANGNECHVCDSVIVDVDGTINPPSPQPCNAGFWVIQAYDSTASGPEPVPNEVWVWNLSSGTSPYQFFWNFGDGTSSSDPFPTHFYASGGPYTLCLTMSDASNCTATYCDSISVDANGIYNVFAGEGNNNRSGFTINVLQQQPTAIYEQEDLNALELWPNPVNDAINISLIGMRSSRIQLSVVDLNGRVVKSTSNAITNGNNRYSLPVNDLESGMYLLRISDDNNVISRRFVKN